MSQEKCSRCSSLAYSLESGLCKECLRIESATIAPTPNPETNRDHDATLAPGSQANGPHAFAKRTETSSPKKQFGDYELIEEIARGGMGVVYKARHVKLNRLTAIKMILSGQFSSADELKRFQIEAEAAARLDHEGIVPVYEIGDQDGQAFFAMKYIGGGSLADRLDEFRDDRKAGMKLLASVARAVHHAHQRTILHRDLKPANILLDEFDRPLITDLGLAKSTLGDSNLTNTGTVLGTPSYMAPEQAMGQQSITTAADIFSLGAIMYELLTGRPPHKGTSAIETVLSVINETPLPPSKMESGVDPELELICLKCIERAPNERYNSAAELANDLEKWAAGETISIKAPSLLMVAQRWFKSNRKLVYAIFAMLLGIAITFPVIGNVFGTGSTIGSIYDEFPDANPPWIFSFLQVPTWLSALALAFLILAIWPSIGLVNAMVTQPKSAIRAIGFGVLTSSVCALLAALTLGWLVVANAVAEYSDERIRVMGEAVWVPDGKTQEESLADVESLYKGLKDIPESERADSLARRVYAEQIARAPKLVGRIGLACLFLIVPIVYGTLIAYWLLRRRMPIWLVVPRYGIAWVAVSLAIGLAFAYYWEGQINNRPAREQPILFLVMLFGAILVAYLAIRRWKKMPAEKVA